MPYSDNITKAYKENATKMVKSGFLEPCRLWGTPIIVVPKANGDVHFYVNFSISINSHFKITSRFLPLIDDGKYSGYLEVFMYALWRIVGTRRISEIIRSILTRTGIIFIYLNDILVWGTD